VTLKSWLEVTLGHWK